MVKKKSKINHWRLPFDYLVVTLNLFVSVSLLGIISFNLTVFDPIKKALADFNFADLLYSKLNTSQGTIDTNIVLVNIGHLDRAGIAEQIRLIRKNNPRVIGFDGFFSARRDSATDAILQERFSESDNFIMACYLTGKNELTGKFDSLEISNPYFNSGKRGFVNLGGASPKTSVVRTFSPRQIFRGDTIDALSASLVKRFDPSAFSKLMQRGNKREVINYRGDTNAYISYDVREVLDSNADLSYIRNKIVLMGYIGESFQGPHDLEDIWYTPMNSELSGRSWPDMYGVVIHANIVSMIINGNYINVMPAWLCILLSFILCYFFIVFITWWNGRKPLLFNVLFPVFLLVLNILIIYLFFVIYKYWNYSINSGYFLAPVLLYKTFLTFYERALQVLNRHYKIKSIFLPKK